MSGRRISPLLLSTRAGFAALRSNVLRTALSALGVIIGVGAIISVLALSDGFERTLRDQMASDGRLQSVSIASRTEDIIDGQPIPRASFPRFAMAEAESLAAVVGDQADVYMGVTSPVLVALAARDSARGAGMAATLSNGLQRRKQQLAAGRFFTNAEVRDSARVAVLSDALATVLARGADVSTLVGRQLLVNGEAWKTIGVVARDSAASPAGPRRLSFYAPVTAAQATLATTVRPPVPEIVVVARKVEDVNLVKAAAEQWLARRYPQWKQEIRVASYEREGNQARTAMMLFKLLMGAITGVSLVVGGIGIMNVLLASVTERTREIGVRKATGARNKDVLAQFLAESVAIAGIGGVLGTALGVGVAVAVAAVMRARTGAPIEAGFSLATLAVAVAAPLIVGLVFGTYPALRASRLSPIDAIRHE